MASPGAETYAFILRIWQEPREIENAAPEWRAMIEHVQTGKRRYLSLGQGSRPSTNQLCALIGQLIWE